MIIKDVGNPIVERPHLLWHMIGEKKRHFIHELISEGEHEHQDFKYQISDARKIARSISAFANNDGGHLLIGVKDNGKIVGVSSDEEIYMIEQAAQMYCQPPQDVTCRVYRVEGKNVLKVDIAEAEEKPVKAPDDNGKWRTYYRIADENIEASRIHEKVLRNRSEEAGYTLSYSDNERQLLDYLSNHGGITLSGYMKLTHISHATAEASVVNLCDMGVIELTYHNGNCLLRLTEE